MKLLLLVTGRLCNDMQRQKLSLVVRCWSRGKEGEVRKRGVDKEKEGQIPRSVDLSHGVAVAA